MTLRYSMSSEEFERFLEPHRRALEKLELELGFFLKDVQDVDVFSISKRMKEYKSAHRKSELLKINIEELQDLAGMRIVVGTLPEVPIIERFFTRQEFGEDLKIAKREKVAKDNGYRALHLVVEIDGNYQRSVFSARVEVQIQTIFEHSFNFLSRKWLYKKPWQVSDKWKKTFENLSENLLTIEKEAQLLHLELIHAISNDDESPLTPHSLVVLTEKIFGERVSMEDAVDSCRQLVDLGYLTNHQYRGFLNREDILKSYNLFQSIRKNNPAVEKIASMSKFGFWGLFGLRIHNSGFKELVIGISKKVEDN